MGEVAGLLEGSADVFAEIDGAIFEPGGDSVAEDGHAHPGGEIGFGGGEAAVGEGGGYGGDEGAGFGHGALLEGGAGGDDVLAGLGEGAVVDEGLLDGVEGEEEGGPGGEGFGGGADGGGEGVGEGGVAVEEDFALVGEVAEEGALGDAGLLRYFEGSDVVIAMLAEEFEGGPLEALADIVAISCHEVPLVSD